MTKTSLSSKPSALTKEEWKRRYRTY